MRVGRLRGRKNVLWAMALPPRKAVLRQTWTSAPLVGMALDGDAEGGGGGGGAGAGGVVHAVGERLAGREVVHRGVGVIERIGELAVGIDVERAVEAGDVDADVRYGTVDGADGLRASTAGVVVEHIAVDW